MSIFVTAAATCPTCGTEMTLQYPASINADRRPDLRASILDGSLYTLPCRSCGEVLTFEPHVTYLDLSRRQWILAETIDAGADWRAAEASALGVYELAFGAAAPAPARSMAASLVPRLVFGWPALIEKLRCGDLGIDDVALEALKLAILRQGPARPIDPDQDLRLMAREEDDLILAWVDRENGAEAARLTVPEAAYLLIKGGGADWDALARVVAGRMFVDMGRVLRDSAPAATV
jgi:hypothetical protein